MWWRTRSWSQACGGATAARRVAAALSGRVHARVCRLRARWLAGCARRCGALRWAVCAIVPAAGAPGGAGMRWRACAARGERAAARCCAAVRLAVRAVPRAACACGALCCLVLRAHACVPDARQAWAHSAAVRARGAACALCCGEGWQRWWWLRGRCVRVAVAARCRACMRCGAARVCCCAAWRVGMARRWHAALLALLAVVAALWAGVVACACAGVRRGEVRGGRALWRCRVAAPAAQWLRRHAMCACCAAVCFGCLVCGALRVRACGVWAGLKCDGRSRCAARELPLRLRWRWRCACCAAACLCGAAACGAGRCAAAAAWRGAAWRHVAGAGVVGRALCVRCGGVSCDGAAACARGARWRVVRMGCCAAWLARVGSGWISAVCACRRRAVLWCDACGLRNAGGCACARLLCMACLWLLALSSLNTFIADAGKRTLCRKLEQRFFNSESPRVNHYGYGPGQRVDHNFHQQSGVESVLKLDSRLHEE
ncbi:hypothetical protein CEXT_110241 [Caerostris extrusa]|uniref:Uncharacterized protein n=1 Tax=Caerostris extrusa TaxID=172846 RepID=A0AAV4RFL3_CAEEX|nr:hypothetical protein CEXT_110241 [Caerostris extrusa]